MMSGAGVIGAGGVLGPGGMGDMQLFDTQFEIMNPTSKGIDRLFNEEDRSKLKTIQDQL